MTKEEFIKSLKTGYDLLARPDTPTDRAFKNGYTCAANNLFFIVEDLEEKLQVSQTNEETYRLEMQEITKILGLDEHTLFDDVKDYANNLKSIIKELRQYVETHKKLSLFCDCREPEKDWSYDLECSANDILEILDKENKYE